MSKDIYETDFQKIVNGGRLVTAEELANLGDYEHFQGIKGMPEGVVDATDADHPGKNVPSS
jgi:hypothetical protein